MKPVLELLSRLRKAGISVRVDGVQLRISAPEGTLTPALRDEILDQKAAILALLKQTNDNSGSQAIPRNNVVESLPLSFAQERLWFLDQLEPNNVLYNVPVGMRLEGELDVRVLRESLGEIVKRHESLRTHFKTVDGQPCQVVEPVMSMELPVVDLSGWPESGREAEARRLCLEEAQRPFDLARGPVLRARLLRLGSREHIFLLVMHHIASDGWSIWVLMSELKALYQALGAGQTSPLPELPIQYADFAMWQRGWLQGAVLERQLEYWKRQLAGAPGLLELPTDRPRPAIQSYRGTILSHKLPETLLPALTELGRREGASLFMTLLAGFQTLLYRYTGQEDVVVGSAIAGRNRAEVESLIGFFVNTLVLRGDLSGDPTFRELLGRTREVALGAYGHQDLPFEKLVEALQPQRDMSHAPLFQVMFVLQNVPVEQAQLTGVKTAPFSLGSNASKFDLTFSIQEDEKSLQLEVEYSTDLFDAERIGRMVGHYQTLLEGILSNPDERLSALPLLTGAEREQLLVGWNDTARDYPRDKCIHELFEGQVEAAPEAVAVVFEKERLTYRQLNERANQLAHHLRKLGVTSGSPVGIYLGRSVNFTVCTLGILKAGGAYVPLSMDDPVERLRFLARDSGISVIITDQPFPGDMELQKIVIVDLAADAGLINSCATNNPAHLGSAVDPAYLMYTSGSTGQPKGASIPHRAVIRLVRGQDYAEFDRHQKFLLLASTSFDASTFELWAPLLNGATCVIFPEQPLDFESLEKAIRLHGITCLWLTSGLFNQIIDFRPSVLETVSHVLAGGEALSVPHIRKAIGRLPKLRLTNGYGPTECTTFTCTYPISQKNGAFPVDSMPIGRPLANMRCYLLDAQRHLVPVGVPGELYVGGDGLAHGYVNRPELTAEKFVTDPFSEDGKARLYRTGDRCRWLPDGNIEYLGRLDHQVKIRGFRIELGEIETQLNQCPEVLEAVVLARDDNPGCKRLVAYLLPKNGAAPKTSELRNLLQAKLPEYMVPSAYVLLQQFPLTPNGKVDRRALPKPEFEPAVVGFVPPSTPLEIELAKIWRELLGLKQVGLYDNFFEIGGQSLLAIRLVSEINRLLKLNLPVRALFQYPTIGGLVNSLAPQGSKEPGQQLDRGRKPELVQLHAGNSGLELCFLIDEGSLGLFKLAHMMKGDLTLYASVAPLTETALRASVDKRLSALPRMEDLAADHVSLILSRPAHGPLLLMGHCFGGLLAFEVARQLQLAGRKVEAVLMLDTWMKQPTSWWWWKKTWLQAHFRKLRQKGPNYLFRKILRRIGLEKNELITKRKLMANDDYTVQVPWAIIVRIYRFATAGYHPHILPGSGILFLSQDDWQSNAYRLKDNSLGASQWFADGVKVVDVPGDHVTVLDEANLSELAQNIKETLGILQANYNKEAVGQLKPDQNRLL